MSPFSPHFLEKQNDDCPLCGAPLQQKRENKELHFICPLCLFEGPTIGQNEIISTEENYY